MDEVPVGGEDDGHGGPGDGLHVGGHVAREHLLGRVQVQHVPHVAQAGVLPLFCQCQVHISHTGCLLITVSVKQEGFSSF